MSDQQPSDPFSAPSGDQPPPSVSPPPYGSAPPPPGYAPGYAVEEQPLSQSDERMWALLAHLSIFVLSLIGPILILVLLGKRSAFVADQAKEALNFHITVLIASFLSFLLCFVLVGFVLLPLVIVGSMVLGVIAAVQAHQGVAYRYPLTLRLVP